MAKIVTPPTPIPWGLKDPGGGLKPVGGAQPIYNPTGDANSFQGNAGVGTGLTGGLAATAFEESGEFTVLPIRFGYVYKNTIQILANALWIPVLGYGATAEYGIHPDAPSGVLTFPNLPISAWVQIYGWLQFAANATGVRYGRLVDIATGNQLPGGVEGQAGNASLDTAFSWCSLPMQVKALPGVRLDAYQSSGGNLNLLYAALWAKRIY